MVALEDVARKARAASNALGGCGSDARNAALRGMIAELKAQRTHIEEANRRDKDAAKRDGLATALQARLNLEGDKFNTLLDGLNDVLKVEDPVGVVSLARELDEGLELYRVSCPIGVLCIIFESRPEAAVQIASLAVKSANAVILKGGREALESNTALVNAMRAGIARAGLPEDAIQLVSTREDVSGLLKLDKYIDLVIPRGSNQLVRSVMDATKIPVMGHADGICSVFLDRECDVAKAASIAVDAKTQYVAACNTAETLLVDEQCADQVLPSVGKALFAAGVKLHACEKSYPLLSAVVADKEQLVKATEADFRTEYLALEMAVKVIPDVHAAIVHINEHGSHHTDVIVTENGATAEKFMEGVSSAGVYHNCSSRFADGFRYGFGAEVGVSTGRIHARGPVGLEGLLTYKYRMHGNGHRVADYGGPGGKQYTHSKISLAGDAPRAPRLDAPRPASFRLFRLPALPEWSLALAVGAALGFAGAALLARAK